MGLQASARVAGAVARASARIHLETDEQLLSSDLAHISQFVLQSHLESTQDIHICVHSTLPTGIGASKISRST